MNCVTLFRYGTKRKAELRLEHRKKGRNGMPNKAYNFRLYPNPEQKVLLAKTFGCVRLVYTIGLIKNQTIQSRISKIQIQKKWKEQLFDHLLHILFSDFV